MTAASIKISGGPHEYEVLVNGHDLSRIISRDGFGLDFSGDYVTVRMQVVAKAVDLDLPEVLIEALRASEDVAAGGESE